MLPNKQKTRLDKAGQRQNRGRQQYGTLHRTAQRHQERTEIRRGAGSPLIVAGGMGRGSYAGYEKGALNLRIDAEPINSIIY